MLKSVYFYCVKILKCSLFYSLRIETLKSEYCNGVKTKHLLQPPLVKCWLPLCNCYIKII